MGEVKIIGGSREGSRERKYENAIESHISNMKRDRMIKEIEETTLDEKGDQLSEIKSHLKVNIKEDDPRSRKHQLLLNQRKASQSIMEHFDQQ